MKVDLFDYELPAELIAAVPVGRRQDSRLLVLQRESGKLDHRRFSELPELLCGGDLLVMNDARVVPARIRARRETGGRVEMLLVRREEDSEGGGTVWLCMVRSRGGRLREGETLQVEGAGATVTLVESRGGGYWTVAPGEGGVEALFRTGAMPLPPYVLKARRERGLPEQIPELDRERYQTVYAERPGAVAAPTAGLHFTRELLEAVRERGVATEMLSLMVGPGTFRPVRAEEVEDHHLEAELYHLPGGTARAVCGALEEHRRVVAVGTTTCRVLEHVARTGRWEEHSGWTDLYIHPPFEFRAIRGLITNFHLPRSTLLMLVSAFAGREQVLNAYRGAVRERYRFYSYGDAMLIL